ncbi:MAG TPA: hypothetical protein VHS96_15835, partial [Bacteroidia bacterium]|nr:hypothetical protein [Bacteroidia bacterium]
WAKGDDSNAGFLLTPTVSKYEISETKTKKELFTWPFPGKWKACGAFLEAWQLVGCLLGTNFAGDA